MFTITPAIARFKYTALFAVAIPEGPLLAVFAGFLIRRGELVLLPTYIILVLGNILPDILCYIIGRNWGREKIIGKYGARFPVIKEHYALVEHLWTEHFKKTITLSKLAYGLSTPFLMSAGIAGIPFRKYIHWTILTDVCTIGTLIGLGFTFGQAYTIVDRYFNYASIMVALLFVCFFLGYRFVTKRASAQLAEMGSSDA